ncbi:hypothetical protein CCU68_20305 [Pseudomonas gingeri NCPPB 3146 = LMG 5327]|uniref:Uncharacterized protein n=2 Tax=Pseudomonas gingeri TaxID=117681 RepID=A0A7Y7XXV1_9PSED|nr:MULTISPECIES: hypothetical protein [Pseudomonas]NVZ28918.1 hypothetical protein [Pseudomonas gingeri]NWC14325.1 hypothetical protein [Pseudomonas gingeri]PNQ90702.1 hypothetical protein CCU68_20305 [Pseudomonas gingeri NCPPB 3146 = LMG 5327]BBP80186.1 hypothetical protein PHLH7_62900 [Pseudomonas sp. Ost2]
MIIARMFALLLLVFLAAASVAVSAAPSADGETGTDAYVRRMIEATQVAWPALAGFNQATRVFADIQLVTSNGRRAWVMNAQGGREVEMAQVTALGLSHEYQRYRKIRWQGRPAVFVGLGEALPEDERQRLKDPRAVPDVFSLATHEAFHFYAEDDWVVGPGAERSVLYPASAAPRLYRNLIIRHLLAAAQGQPDGLARASHWHRRWLSEHADEARRVGNTDRSEGSARHVESVARLLAQGVRPDSAEWSTLMLEALVRQGREDYLTADHESYVLGDLAGYLLERQGVDWLPRVARGETPVAILLGSLPPLATPADEVLSQRIDAAVAKANRQAAQAFEPFLQRFNDPSGARLMVSNRAMQGSFEIVQSYLLAAQPEKIEVGVRAGFAFRDGRIELRAATVASRLQEACGREDFYWILALTADELEKGDDGRLRVERDDLKLDLPYPVRAVDDPRIWCIEA